MPDDPSMPEQYLRSLAEFADEQKRQDTLNVQLEKLEFFTRRLIRNGTMLATSTMGLLVATIALLSVTLFHP